jgi:hypothetical protein
MIAFNDTAGKVIGRADVAGLATIDGDVVTNSAGRPGFEPYFLVKVVFSSKGKHCLAEVPTGHFKTPTVVTPEEMVVTDGENFWVAARHLNAQQLEANETPVDPGLYVLDEDELPERLTLLTVADREHIVGKIKMYCEEQFQAKDNPRGDGSWV